MPRPTPLDRARGALLGLAVGDALGTTLEFSTPAPRGFATLLEGPHRDITGGGPFHVAPGQVTDDTHMACCLAASLKEHGGYDAADVARRYVEWRRHTFDIGGTTAAAIGHIAQGNLDAGRRVWEAGGRQGAPNGSLMRIAPIGVFFARDGQKRRAAALGDSALTHFDPRCQLACAALTAAIAAFVTPERTTFRELYSAMKDSGVLGEDGADMVKALVARQDTAADAIDIATAEIRLAARDLVETDRSLKEVIRQAGNDLFEDLHLARQDDPQLDGLIHTAQGFVRVAFRLAFWELLHAPSFEAGLIDVVNRGGDADTNGAIAGALLGAWHGAKAIPPAWKERVLGALQKEPAGPLRDAYHPKALMEMVDGVARQGR